MKKLLQALIMMLFFIIMGFNAFRKWKNKDKFEVAIQSYILGGIVMAIITLINVCVIGG